MMSCIQNCKRKYGWDGSEIHSHFDNIELVCDPQTRVTSGFNGLYLN